MTTNRWIASKVEAVEGTNPILTTDTLEKPGIVDSDYKIPWNKQDHDPIYDVTSSIPVAFTKKQSKLDFDIEYYHTHAGWARRLFGAADYTSSVNTFTFPTSYDSSVESWAWNYRSGAKAINALGCVTQKVSLYFEEHAPVRVVESILGHRTTEGTVCTGDPDFPTGLTDELPFFWDQVSLKTMGGDDIGTLVTAHVDFIQVYTAEYGSINSYPSRIVKGREVAVLFDLSAIYDGSTDELRDKLLAASEEPLILKVAKSDTHYLQVELFETVYTGIEMKVLKNGSIVYTVNGYAKPDGSDYVEVKSRGGVDWS